MNARRPIRVWYRIGVGMVLDDGARRYDPSIKGPAGWRIVHYRVGLVHRHLLLAEEERLALRKGSCRFAIFERNRIWGTAATEANVDQVPSVRVCPVDNQSDVGVLWAIFRSALFLRYRGSDSHSSRHNPLLSGLFRGS
jgi:hypothetical protein